MKAYSLIFKKSHQVRETILAEDGDAAEERAKEIAAEFFGDDDGAALEFLWLEDAKANQPFVLGGRTYLTDSETLKVLNNMFPAGSQPDRWAKELKIMLLGQSLGRIIGGKIRIAGLDNSEPIG